MAETKVTEEHKGKMAQWLEEFVETLGAPKEIIEYTATYCFEELDFYVNAYVAIPPHEADPVFTGFYIFGMGLTTKLAVESASRKAFQSLLNKKKDLIKETNFSLFPRGYLRMDGKTTKHYEEMEDALKAEKNLEAEATGRFLLHLSDYVEEVEDQQRVVHRRIGCHASTATQLVPRVLHAEEEVAALKFRLDTLRDELRNKDEALVKAQSEIAQLKWVIEDNFNRKVLMQKEVELLKGQVKDEEIRVKCKDVLYKLAEDKIASLKAGMYPGVMGYRISMLEDRNRINGNNIANLTRIGHYLRDCRWRAFQSWRESDARRVRELEELNAMLPPEQRKDIRRENFKLICSTIKWRRVPYEEMARPVETPETRAAEAMMKPLFTDRHTYQDRVLVEYKKTGVY